MPTVPVWRTVADAYLMPLIDIRGVLLNAWLPFSVFTFVGIAFRFLGVDKSFSGPVIVLTFVVMMTLFAIAIHRRFLFGVQPGTHGIKWRFGPAERVFFGMIFVFAAAITLMGVAFITSSQAGVVAVLFLAVYFLIVGVGVSLSLVFPAAADGQPHPITLGWELGKGIRWRMFAILFLTGMPFSISSAVASRAEDTMASALVLTALYYLGSAITAAGLCIAYKTRMAGRSRTDTAPGEPLGEAAPTAP